MAKTVGKQRSRWNRTRPRRRASVVSVAGLVVSALVLAPDVRAASDAPWARAEVALTAGTVVFIDGHGYPNGSTRMGGELEGLYQLCAASCTGLTAPGPGTAYDYINNTAVYSGTLGLLDGLGAPTGDQSIAAANTALQQELSAISGHTTVVAYSEGAVAASGEVGKVNPNTVSFVLIADADNPNGGILARFPTGTVIPGLGITANGPTTSTGAPVVMVTQQYDGISDAPVYVTNVLADANAILGYIYLHPNYQTVNPDAPGNIVTTSPNGNMVNILVPAAAGAMPILLPFAQLGVPAPILAAVDPALRAIVETAYVRTTDPTQQIQFQLAPPPSAWSADLQAVEAGIAQTMKELPAAIAASLPTPPAAPSVTTAPKPATAARTATTPKPATAGPHKPAKTSAHPKPTIPESVTHATIHVSRPALPETDRWAKTSRDRSDRHTRAGA